MKVLCPVSRLECLRETCAVWMQSEKRCGLTGGRPVERPDKLYTVKEAAEYLNLHEMTVYLRLRKGEMYGVRTGRLWRIPESALREIAALLFIAPVVLNNTTITTSLCVYQFVYCSSHCVVKLYVRMNG